MDPLQTAQVLLKRGMFEEAAAELRNVLVRAPDHLEAQFILGMIACQHLDWQQAEKYLAFVVAKQPKRFEAVYGLGVAKRNLESYDEAIPLLEQATSIVPRHPAAQNELGLCLLQKNDSVAALQAFDIAVASAPQAAQILHNRGLALAMLDRLFEARDMFKRAANLAPGQVESHIQLGMQYERLGDWNSCLQSVQFGLTHCPNDATLLGMLARSYSETTHPEWAELTFKRAVEIHPSLGARYALWLQEEGRFAESVDILWGSLDKFPIQGAAYYGLAEAKVFARDDISFLETALRTLEDPALQPKERVYLLFALGRLKEASREYEAATSFYDQANDAAFSCFNAGRPYDREVVRNITDQTIRQYSREFVTECLSSSGDLPGPILIVGMIRSGTTLLDQILSSHSGVLSAGEQLFWTIQAGIIREKGGARPGDADRKKLRASYRNVLGLEGGGENRIIDKMPLNYAFLGLILEVCPKAKFVHIRRNPLDTCISIYTNHYGLGPNFAYNQSNIAFNYLEYLRLVEHWRRVMPSNVFFELDYENLVRDREGEVRKLVDFCELPWDDACLHHTENQSAIRTPSRWQARQDVYTSSIARWKKFEPWLGELLQLKGISEAYDIGKHEDLFSGE